MKPTNVLQQKKKMFSLVDIAVVYCLFSKNCLRPLSVKKGATVSGSFYKTYGTYMLQYPQVINHKCNTVCMSFSF